MSLRRTAGALCACVVAVLAAVAVAGCGGTGGKGTATLWVTRDDGRTTVAEKAVPVGLNAIQALDRAAKVTTRYGGRYVQSVNGIAGSLSSRHDWFLYVNGYESDRGGVEIVLRPGDVAWWDFHDWSGSEAPLVAGAYPEPFLHGFLGKRRRVLVVYARAGMKAAAERIGKQVGAASVAPAGAVPTGAGDNLVVLRDGAETVRLAFRAAPGRPGDPVQLVVGGPAVERLADDPAAYVRRYEVGVP